MKSESCSEIGKIIEDEKCVSQRGKIEESNEPWESEKQNGCAVHPFGSERENWG
jgi:hypothetical protein